MNLALTGDIKLTFTTSTGDTTGIGSRDKKYLHEHDLQYEF